MVFLVAFQTSHMLLYFLGLFHELVPILEKKSSETFTGKHRLFTFAIYTTNCGLYRKAVFLWWLPFAH